MSVISHRRVGSTKASFLVEFASFRQDHRDSKISQLQAFHIIVHFKTVFNVY